MTFPHYILWAFLGWAIYFQYHAVRDYDRTDLTWQEVTATWAVAMIFAAMDGAVVWAIVEVAK